MTRITIVLLSVMSALAAQQGPGATGPATRPADFKSYSYKKTKEADLRIYLHFPPGWKATDRRPAVVFFFGGGWLHGSADQFIPQAEYLAGRGLVAARADYRVGNRHGVSPDQCVEDAKSAVRWLRKNAADLGIDPDRIAASEGRRAGPGGLHRPDRRPGGRGGGSSGLVQGQCPDPLQSGPRYDS